MRTGSGFAGRFAVFGIRGFFVESELRSRNQKEPGIVVSVGGRCRGSFTKVLEGTVASER